MSAPTVILVTGVSRGTSRTRGVSLFVALHVSLANDIYVFTGIGKAVLQTYLLRSNHTVIGAVRDPADANAQELQKLPTGDGSRLIVVKIDSKAYGDPTEAVKTIEAAGVRYIDVVVANAGGNRDKITPLDDISTEEVLDLFELNTVGPLALFQAVKPLLQKSKTPKWASVSSAAGSITKLEVYRAHVAPAYGIAKAGLNWWTVYASHSALYSKWGR